MVGGLLLVLGLAARLLGGSGGSATVRAAQAARCSVMI
jgi:hypothetical protein